MPFSRFVPSFCIFSVDNTPTLVTLQAKRLNKSDYLRGVLINIAPMFSDATRLLFFVLMNYTSQGFKKRHEEGRMQGALNGAAKA
jgi:hypothetical protein